MRIALTGATGFVGRRCIKRFHDEGFSIRAWYRGEQAPSVDGVQWVHGELDDPEAASRLVVGCDAVVHAALSRQDASFMAEPSDPIAYYQTNVVGSLRLLEASKQEGVSRFVFLSSGAVHERVADDLPLDERHPLWPASLYGACKASVETLVHRFGLSAKLNASTVRPVAIVGIDDPISKSKWFDIVQSVVNHDSLKVTGGGKVVFVDELVSAIQCLLQSEAETSGQTYNACSGFVSQYEVASIAKEVSGSNAILEGEPKLPGREMSTTKGERAGMRFGVESWLRSYVTDLVQAEK